MTFSLDCYLAKLSEVNTIKIIYLRMIVNLVLPFGLIIIISIFYAIKFRFKREENIASIIYSTLIYIFLYV